MNNELKEIAQQLRAMYPDAASVELFVNHQEHEIQVKYVDPQKAGCSMKSLNGEWIKSEVPHEQ